eukprot:TRINITY_DN66069_c0_g1_i1.p1 TRINITY_DN66069_c0_g1~~TRINITY_DN66069_c0_g1_i1.p1  ORF type:complete len:163 (+),score=60.30 TRINITY_DN66069_c0_g1_i1:50-490(+)
MAQPADELETDEEWSEQNVMVELVNYDGMTVDLTGVALQIVGLETDAPVLRLGDKHYEGTWCEFIGTGVLLDEDQNVAALCEKKLSFKRVLPLHLKDVSRNHPISGEPQNVAGATGKDQAEEAPSQTVPHPLDMFPQDAAGGSPTG